MEKNEKRRTKCTIYTRVMGFCRPVSHFNIGKKSEFYSRTAFKWEKSLCARFNEKYAEEKCGCGANCNCPSCGC